MYNLNAKEVKFMNKKILIGIGIIVLIALFGFLIIKGLSKDTEKNTVKSYRISVHLLSASRTDPK